MSDAAFSRHYLGREDVLAEWTVIEPYFEELEGRTLDTVQALNQWTLDCSELEAAIDQIGVDRYVRMTCQTDDPEREQAYLEFIESITPRCEPRWQALRIKYASCPHARELPTARFAVYDRSMRNQVELFRDENVPLQVEEAKLCQQYQKISGAQTVGFEGDERTLQQMDLYLERTDRPLRRRAWEASSRRRLEDASKLEALFEELLTLRGRIARNTGAADYREYAFKAKERFDYTPEDCLAFHDSVERAVVPALRELHGRRRQALAVEVLRPWDLAVDEQGQPPLKPFETTDELGALCSQMFHRIAPELGAQFEEMSRGGHLDLASRKGKAPGGYQTTYEEARHPFIFMNAVGLHRDVETLLHEGGHAFHTYAARHDPLMAYRSSPLEFAEVASMAMELLAYDHLDLVYTGEDLRRARRKQLRGVITVLPWIATIDAFQHWLYTHPEHPAEARRDCWLSLRERFGGRESFDGYGQDLALYWLRQLHLFQVPFYYIEYGIAQLGALQVWQNARKDRAGAVRAYQDALALGGSRPLPELFSTAAIRFDFSYDTISPLVDMLMAELDSLADSAD
ncbi:MAG: M3 family oligoendopeptidase [bacterium]|nr:M3 family oligoendopeptidase [bacterium]